MDIIDHKLIDDEGVLNFTEGNFIGAEIEPSYVIMHATGTASPYKNNVEAFTEESYPASVHLLIGRNGEYHQYVPFDRRAKHCGANHWDHVYKDMDGHAIGIEMLNAGLLTLDGEGGYYKTTYGVDYPIELGDREFKRHRWWQIFTQAQLDKALEIVRLLFQTYPRLKEVLRHSDVNTSGEREFCPGPVFPMQWFHAHVLGLDESLPITRVHKNPYYAPLYHGPGAETGRMDQALNPNTRLGILSERDQWVYVHVIGHPDTESYLTGWIEGYRIEEDDLYPSHYHQPPDIFVPGD